MKFVFPLLSFRKHGGVRVLSILMNYLAEHGHNVLMLVPQNAFESFYPISPKVKIEFLKPLRKSPFHTLLTLLELSLKIPKADFVVVSFFPLFYPALFSKYLKGNKIIYYLQDVESIFYPFPFSLMANLTYSLKSEIKLSVSQWVKRGTHSQGPILHPPIQSAFLKTELPETEKKPKEITLFYRKKKIKGQATALQFLRHPENARYKINIVGDPLKWNAENVVCYGYLSTEELIKVLDRSSFFILPSKIEGFALPPLEAMARGAVPILFTRTGPLDYIENGKNGFIVDSVDKAYEVMEKLSKDFNLWKEISKNAMESAKEYTEEKFVENFLKILDSTHQAARFDKPRFFL